MQINEIITRSFIEELLEKANQIDEIEGNPNDPNEVPLEVTAIVGGSVTTIAALFSAADNVPYLNKLFPSAPTAEPPSARSLQRTIDKLSEIPATQTRFRVDGQRRWRVMYPMGSIDGPGVADFPDADSAAKALNDYNTNKSITPGERRYAVSDDKLPGRVKRWQNNGFRSIRLSAQRLTSSIVLKDWRTNSRWFRILQKFARWGAPVIIVTDLVDNIVWMILREAENPEHGGDWVKITMAAKAEIGAYLVRYLPTVIRDLMIWWASVLIVAKTLKLIINGIFWAIRIAGLGTGPGAPFVWIGSLVGQIGFSWWAATDSGKRALTSLWTWFLGYAIPGVIGDGIIANTSERASEVVMPQVESDVARMMERYGSMDSDEAEAAVPTDANGELPTENPQTTQTRPTTTPSTTPPSTSSSTPRAPADSSMYQGFSFSN